MPTFPPAFFCQISVKPGFHIAIMLPVLNNLIMKEFCSTVTIKFHFAEGQITSQNSVRDFCDFEIT